MSLRGLLLVAHGSRRGGANGEVRRLAERLGARVRPAFSLTGCAFLELAEPNISAGLLGLINSGAEDIVIVPYFLAAGHHVVEDVPAAVNAVRAEHPSVRLRLMPYLGASEELVDLLARAADADTVVAADAG